MARRQTSPTRKWGGLVGTLEENRMTDINYPPNGSWTGHSHSPFEDSVREIMTEMGASFAGLWRKPMALEYATAYLDGRLVFYTHKEGTRCAIPPR